MKKSAPFIVLAILGAAVVIPLSIALGFIEIRAVLAGDAGLYENAFAQTLRLLLRLFGLIFALVSAVLSLIGAKKKGAVAAIAIALCLGSLIFALFSLFFYEWYIGLALIVGLLFVASPAFRASLEWGKFSGTSR